MAEEYCWAITQAAYRSCRHSEGFQLACSVYIHIYLIMCILNSALGKMRLTPDVSESDTVIFTVLFEHPHVCDVNIMTSEFNL